MTADDEDARRASYVNPQLLPPTEVLAILDAGTERQVREALIGQALYGEDRSFIEWAAREVVKRRTVELHDLPPICLFHVARRWGTLEPASWAVLEQLRRTPDLEGWVDEYLEDINWQIRLWHD
jgi:hypothetical protein